jgi:hypothetical protein
VSILIIIALVIIPVLTCFIIPVGDSTQIYKVETLSTSTIPIPDFSTKYNIHYRMVNYDEVHRYSADNSPTINGAVDYIDISILRPTLSGNGSENSYRTLVLKNGSILVFNVTNIHDGFTWYETGLEKGIDISYLLKWNLDMDEFELQKAFTTPTELVCLGKNTTTDEISIFQLKFTGTHFDYMSNVTIPNPGLFTSINDMKIYSAIYQTPYSYIAGKFRDGTTNIPFGYSLDGSFSIVQDFTNVSISTTDCLIFDDAILSLQPSSIVIYSFSLTNKHVFMVDGSSKIVYNNTIEQIPLSYVPAYFRVSKPFNWVIAGTVTYFYETLIWNYLTTTFNTYRLFVNYSTDYGVFYTIEKDQNIGFLPQQIESDVTIKIMTDLSDGVVLFGQDTRFKIWQTWFISSGSRSGLFFDIYIPYKLITYEEVSNRESFEIWFGDSRGLFFAAFNANDSGILDYGNSSVNKIVSQQCHVSHAQGTSNFQYTISGYLERNSTNICEIGIIPLYAQPTGNPNFPDPTMLSVSSLYTFDNNIDGGIILQPSENFRGIGSNIIEFQVRFDADYCPLSVDYLGLKYIALNIYYLAWEKYDNGTYTQKLLKTTFTAKSALFMYSFALESAITIQDSHMLDELHVFNNGIEYSAYNLVFTAPNASLLVTDKFTNETLYNAGTWFSDPIKLPIAAKYEFWLRYYSTLDNLGFPWELVQTYINGSQVTTENIRVLSPNANIVVKDFSNTVIKNLTINRYIDGNYINIGLPIASIILSNQHDFTVDFFLTRNQKTIYYQLPPDTQIILRLALGKYTYIVMDLNGTEIEKKDIEFKSNDIPSITLGKKTIPEAQPIPTELNIIIAVISIAGITGAGIVLASAFKKQGKPGKKLPWG